MSEDETTISEELHGTIKSYLVVRGFGFITPHGGGQEVFFHKRQLESSFVIEGDKVSFILAVSKKYPGKLMAQHVRIVR